MPRILVVDDEPLIAMMLTDWLAEQGVETAGPAHTVAQALSVIDAIKIDAAVLDISLGDDDCYAVADMLASRGIPFAFATGHSSDSLAERFKGVATVTKPFDFEVVRQAISRLLGRPAA